MIFKIAQHAVITGFVNYAVMSILSLKISNTVLPIAGSFKLKIVINANLIILH